MWFTQNEYGVRRPGWIYLAIRYAAWVAGVVMAGASVPVLLAIAMWELAKEWLGYPPRQ